VLLEDLLGTWPDLHVNIDPKHESAVEALGDVLERLGALDRVCVGSFSDRRLARLRRRFGQRLCTSLGPLGVLRLRAASVRLPVGAPRADCVHIPTHIARHQLVDPRLVSRAHADGLAVHVWTIDDVDEMARLLDLGVDGIMTDRPATLRELLVRRGQWIDAA
jgi:glycerophosphoryl diester phosphodiesterase